ncbi:hypothetical protein ACIRLA_21750 [Streptomyces sp. NPDC102364]|uniref:hypothetical protein n=1 Tax=Streptomyces sp. NPDC102364 TaxID=3366161 RepID=UPI0038225A38
MDAPGRYLLTFAADGRTVATGRWDLHATAEKKFRDWVGDHGRGTARITLVDTETGETLKAWP